MNVFIKSILASSLAGIGGTCSGSILAIVILKLFGKGKSHNSLNGLIKMLMGFSGGIMLVVICFDLIPGALRYANFTSSTIAVVLGCLIVPLLNLIIQSLKSIPEKTASYRKNNNYAKVSAIVFFSIALHNFPEGLAVGSGYSASVDYGLAIAVVIAMHNIPEGIALAVPMVANNKSAKNVIFAAFLSGLPTIIGALIGWCIASISAEFVGLCLGFAGGAMLYVVLGQLFPISYDKKSKLIVPFTLFGFIVGLFITS